jgi:hypothetical protein
MIEVLDRVLDKGVVVIATVGVSVVGLRLVDLDARVVLSSIDTYVEKADVIEAAAYARPLPVGPHAPPPALGEPRPPVVRPQAKAPRKPPRRAPRRRLRVRPLSGLVRCADGCTFERDMVTSMDGMLTCPYRRGVRCPVQGD